MSILRVVLHEENGEKAGFRKIEEIEIIRRDLLQILMNSIKEVPYHFNQVVNTIQQNNTGVKVFY